MYTEKQVIKNLIMSDKKTNNNSQAVYAIIAGHLFTIGNHPYLTQRGVFGYFMTIENIKEKNKSLNPEDWLKGEEFKQKKSFS
ncbi:MAG: hypothetical protein WDK96_02660 [Candidatus Paceibacterota bacterium]|jgi:hypothetical protein